MTYTNVPLKGVIKTKRGGRLPAFCYFTYVMGSEVRFSVRYQDLQPANYTKI